jgi:hypothetical protein
LKLPLIFCLFYIVPNTFRFLSLQLCSLSTNQTLPLVIPQVMEAVDLMDEDTAGKPQEVPFTIKERIQQLGEIDKVG